MFSNKKPPLPKYSIIGQKPEIYCLDFFGIARKKCKKFNKKKR
mgnify:CR=1 FL=1